MSLQRKNPIRRSLSWSRKLLRSAVLDLNDYRRTVLLAGTGRSGTTWIGEVINYDNSYRLMFEPFHPGVVPLVKHFGGRRYLRPDNRDPRFLEPAEAILSGRIRHTWIDQYNRKVLARQRLIKDIYVNLMLKWIKVNFPAIPIILLVRHPCAVARSQVERSWDINPKQRMFVQEELVADFLTPYVEEVETLKSDFERHVLNWCIENYVPLKQFRANAVHLVYYEHFCTQPEEEIARLFTFLGKPYNPEVQQQLHTPSRSTATSSAIRQGTNLIESWRKGVGKEEVERAVEILRLFGLERIYADDPMPLVASGENPFAS